MSRPSTLVLVFLLLSSCTFATRSPTGASTARTSTAFPGRVAVILMENHSAAQIIGNRDAPYLNGLARRYALATSYSALTHPSLPNYLALLGGSTFGIMSDCTACHVAARNLVDGLEAKHVSWKGYMESMPRDCFTGAFADHHYYAKVTDPFVYFPDITSSDMRCDNVVSFAAIDYAHLPRFTWITPNLCDDMHSCPVAQGDRFLARTVPRLLKVLGRDGVLFITFDEGSDKDNHVATIVAGGGAIPGRYAEAFNHYSLLRSIEEHFGIPLTGAAASATSMSAILR